MHIEMDKFEDHHISGAPETSESWVRAGLPSSLPPALGWLGKMTTSSILSRPGGLAWERKRGGSKTLQPQALGVVCLARREDTRLSFNS